MDNVGVLLRHVSGLLSLLLQRVARLLGKAGAAATGERIAMTTTAVEPAIHAVASTLIEALPFMQSVFNDQYVSHPRL